LQKSLLGYYGVWKKAIAHPFFAIAFGTSEADRHA
jgi:hypothetical protein